MKRAHWGLIAGAALIVALLLGWMRSNLGRGAGLAQLATGADGRNELLLTGPYGWQCIDYAKSIGLSGELEIVASGRFECPLFGGGRITSTDYPALSQRIEVPLEQHTRIYQSPDGRFELYVLITEDAGAFARLEE
ncbi:MAG TPA: hypothetical protein VGE07_06075 [Herpetosiphonaceae bacterium]